MSKVISEEINVQSVIDKYHNPHNYNNVLKRYNICESDVKEIVKEIVELVIEKCADSAELTTIEVWSGSFSSDSIKTIIDKDSILDVKDLVNYEIYEI